MDNMTITRDGIEWQVRLKPKKRGVTVWRYHAGKYPTELDVYQRFLLDMGLTHKEQTNGYAESRA